VSGELLLITVLEAKLTPRQREAFIDHAFVGRRVLDIAADLGVSPQATYGLLRKARTKLARAYERDAA
jgi:DNA-directed RNA polymerase specialized sigma24 family protein